MFSLAAFPSVMGSYNSFCEAYMTPLLHHHEEHGVMTCSLGRGKSSLLAFSTCAYTNSIVWQIEPSVVGVLGGIIADGSHIVL